jgi:hypothetical protein
MTLRLAGPARGFVRGAREARGSQIRRAVVERMSLEAAPVTCLAESSDLALPSFLVALPSFFST